MVLTSIGLMFLLIFGPLFVLTLIANLQAPILGDVEEIAVLTFGLAAGAGIVMALAGLFT